MDVIVQLLQLIFAPLSIGIVVIAIVGGIFLGALYNAKMDIPEETVFHKAIAGWNFIAFIFVFRLVTSIAEGVVLTNYAGWIGIAILWGIYVMSIWAGHKLVKRFSHRRY